MIWFEDSISSAYRRLALMEGYMTGFARHFALALALVVTFAGSADAQRPIPINVESSPPGATVYLDTVNADSRVGTTPLRNVRIPRGTHVLIFQLASHEEARLDVNIRRRRETFRVELNALSTISISAANTAASGAAVRIDGQPVGNVPYTAQVQPGRHLVQVGREGHVTFSQWVDLAGGQGMQVPVTLEEEAARTGSLLVAGDVSGAEIRIDGQPQGTTPAVIDGLSEGQHLVEVRSTDAAMTPFSQTVRIVAGERAVLNPTMRPAAPTGGSLRVLVTPTTAQAIVSVDGEVLGEAPASASELTPGEHIVEAQAEGFVAAQQPVTVESGRQRVISITLQPVAAAPGRIVVNANVDGATVIVDGEERGAPPVVIEEASTGTHAVIVRAVGHQEFRQTCNVGPGVNCEVSAELQPVGTQVRVEANVPGAQFFVDGEPVGPVPWEGTIPVGSHSLEVRAAGYRPYAEQVALQASDETRLINAGLVGLDELTPEERLERVEARRARHQQAVSRSGATLPDDLAVLDFSTGWPHLFEFRLGIGVLPWLEAGVGIRTFGVLTEFEGRLKAGWRPVDQFSLGAQVRVGGGLGPARDATDEEVAAAMAMGTQAEDHPTSSFFFSLEGLISLHFLRAGNATMWVGMDVHSDRWDWNGSDRNCRYADGCGMGGRMELIDGRQNLVRLRLGGSLEFILNRNWNAWGSFESVLAGADRRILGDVLGADNSDLQHYFRLGFTYKFGYAERDED